MSCTIAQFLRHAVGGADGDLHQPDLAAARQPDRVQLPLPPASGTENSVTLALLPLLQGCLQYHTGWYGTVKSFNYDTSSTYDHLDSQDYNICVRRESGYCKIGWNQVRLLGNFSKTN